MRPYLYPIALVLLLSVWCLCMQTTGSWGLLSDYWQMAATMVLGSFVAGSTPAGGGSVAFPIFTKVLEIKSSDAALFGLMIQSVGMTMAALFILSRGIAFYRHVYWFAAAGGCVAVVPAVLFLRIPAPYPKLLFSCLIFAFGLVLYWLQSRKTERNATEFTSELSTSQRMHLFLTGAAGGVLASQLGSGADMVTFIVIVVAFDLVPKRAIPTTVLTMATISVIGFIAKLSLQPQEIGIVWKYWTVCVPIVAVGAPLGAFVVSTLPQRTVVSWVLALIAAEISSTLLVVRFTPERVGFVVITLSLAAAWIWFLMQCRRGKRTGTPSAFAIDN